MPGSTVCFVEDQGLHNELHEKIGGESLRDCRTDIIVVQIVLSSGRVKP